MNVLDEQTRSHSRLLPGECDRAGSYADKMIQQLKHFDPELAWRELEDIIEPEVISDFVMEKTLNDDETFEQIVEREGKLILTTQIILIFEEKISEYYISQYFGG